MPSSEPLPAEDEDIAFAPVGALANWIRSGVLSSARLTEIYLERIARIGPTLECIALAHTRSCTATSGRRLTRCSPSGTYLGPLPWNTVGLQGRVRYQGDRDGMGRGALPRPPA